MSPKNKAKYSLRFTGKHGIFKNLLLWGMEGYEELSNLFEFKLKCISYLKAEIDIEKLLGSQISFEINYKEKSNKKRIFSGIIASVEELGIDTVTGSSKQFKKHQIIMKPSLWKTTFGKKFKIFQNKKVLDIIKSILKDHKIKLQTNDLNQKGVMIEKLFLCSQYDETDFDFVSRLMEKYGIGYYFKHSEKEDTLMLFNSMKSFKLHSCIYNNGNIDYQYNTIHSCYEKRQIGLEGYQVTDYNHKTPSVEIVSKNNAKQYKWYEYPGGISDTKGSEFMKQKIELEYKWQKYKYRIQSTAVTLSPGNGFSVKIGKEKIEAYIYKTNHFMYNTESFDSQSGDDLIEFYNVYGISAKYNGFLCEYENKVKAFQKHGKIIYMPIRKTKRQKIYGVQSAVVSGRDSKKIFYINEKKKEHFIAVKVRFYWNPEGKKNQAKDATSCWVRVMQNFAGNNFGSYFVPRLGQEVMISFIDGDPDRPIIIGMAYNAKNIPPYEKGFETGIKTQTISDPKKFNEIYFSDEKNKELIRLRQVQKGDKKKPQNTQQLVLDAKNGSEKIEILQQTSNNKKNSMVFQGKSDKEKIHMHAEKDFDIVVENGDMKITIEKKNIKITTKKGNVIIDSAKNINMKARKDIQIQAHGNIKMKAMKNFEQSSVSGQMKMQAKAKNIDMQAMQNIQMKAITKDIKMMATSNIKLTAVTQNIKMTAGMNYEIKSGMNVKVVSGMKIDMKSGLKVDMISGIAFGVKAGVACNLNIAAAMSCTVGAAINMTAGAGMNMTAGAAANVTAGAAASVTAGAGMNMTAGAAANVTAGAAANVTAGAAANVTGGAAVNIIGASINLLGAPTTWMPMPY